MTATDTRMDPAAVEWLKAQHPEPHPMLPVMSLDEALALMQTEKGQEHYVDWLNHHNELVRLAEEDPLYHGFEPDFWHDADTLLESPNVDIQATFGTNRIGKSYRFAKRVCEAAMAYPNGQILILGETADSSKFTQQALVKHFLWHHIKHLNGKQHPVYKVKYSAANGFTEGILMLPNHTLISFDTYNGDPGKYEGWEFGAPVKELKRRPDGSLILNIGWWADESLTLKWLQMLSRRGRFRRAKGCWSFTPVKGITPAVKEFVGTPKVVSSRPASLLPQAKVLGCPKGHMPYVIEPSYPRSSAIYFHVDQMKFGDYETIIREDCENKPTEYIERVAYGYARDSISRAFPMYGPENKVKVENLPSTGTMYQYIDPHGARNYAIIWVLVTPGDRPDYYVVRDWPDMQTFGEWAVPTERETTEDTRKGWDGDKGPAQTGQGWGVVRYKEMFLASETVTATGTARALSNQKPAPERLAVEEALKEEYPHPWRRRLMVDAIMEGKDLDKVREPVAGRAMDKRFANTKHAEEHGGTCLLWQFQDEQRDPKTGQVTGPAMDFHEATGVTTDHGIQLLQDLLHWNKEEPLVPHMNAPRLYVSEECKQVDWALGNYTGLAGESGACKDFIDVLRHMAEDSPVYLGGDGKVKTTGGGAY